MMTEQELNNLISEKAQTNTASIAHEIVRLSQELEQKARELQSDRCAWRSGASSTVCRQ
jgi:hypothetical protein